MLRSFQLLPPPRSRHLPVAVTDGSLTENLNEIGVRLWTDRSHVEGADRARHLCVEFRKVPPGVRNDGCLVRSGAALLCVLGWPRGCR